jgi:hypothetical protein
MEPYPAVKSVADEADETGLSWLRTWASVFLVVIIHFIAWLVLIVALTDSYS